MSSFFRVKNFEKFQHYKDRNPPWIKLHTRLIEDYEFTQLPNSMKWQLVGIWILASRLDNKLPADPVWLAGKIGSDTPVPLDALIHAGFLHAWTGDSEGGQRENWPSRYIPQPVRDQVMERDGYKCVWCGATDKLEIDHITPISQGGTGVIENLQVLCVSCNRKKRATQLRSNSRTESTQECSPETERESETKTEKTDAPHGAPFSKFWQAYPIKKSKGQAEKAWKKLKPTGELLATMLDAIKAQTAERQIKTQRGEFVPEWKHPATWLNARDWEDEPIAPSVAARVIKDFPA